MTKLTALKPHKYGRRRLKPGDDYEAADKDARILVAIKKAKPAAEAPTSPKKQEIPALKTASKKQKPETKAAKPEADAPEPETNGQKTKKISAENEKPRGGSYKTRVLKAEQD